LGRWEEGQHIAVFPHVAKTNLSRLGYSPEAVFRSWRERGWLKTQDHGFTYRVRVAGIPQHMIVLDWSAILKASGAEGASV